MMRFLSFLLCSGILAFAVSCTGLRKTTTSNYLQSLSDTSRRDTIGKEAVVMPEVVIQKNDLLSIQVYSASLNPQVDAFYNLPQGATTTATGSGFLVDARGNIEYPRIGSLHVEGLTKTQLADLIKQKLEGQLTQPSVVIRFVNYKITVLGEVRTPGSFTVPTERLTVLEALGLAGDVTEFGQKNNIKVLRENNGKREVGLLDLTSSAMFNSPFYNLQQNDVVFVEQNGQRTKEREQQNTATRVGLAATIITSIALILNIIK
jgi:polysaccharide export outer membrane protein